MESGRSKLPFAETFFFSRSVWLLPRMSWKFTTTSARMPPMRAITTRISIRVKPRARRFLENRFFMGMGVVGSERNSVVADVFAHGKHGHDDGDHTEADHGDDESEER